MVASVASSSSIYSDHAKKPCIDIFNSLGIKILPTIRETSVKNLIS